MWPYRVVLRELRSTVIVEGWRAALIVALGACIVGGVVTAELDQIRTAVQLEANLSSAGRYAFVALPAGEGASLASGRCLAIGNSPAVVAVGGLSEAGPVTIRSAPGAIFNLRLMVGDTVEMLSPNSGELPGDLFVAEPAAERTGLATGMNVLVDRQDRPVRIRVLDMGSRIPEPGPWLWAMAAPGLPLDECWVEVDKGARSGAAEWIATWLSEGDEIPVVVPFLPEERLRVEPLDAFNGRGNRFAWILGGLALGTVVAFVVWARRSEIALYRSVGSSRSQTSLIVSGPYFVLLLVGGIAGAFLGLCLERLGGQNLPVQLASASRQAGLIVALASLIVALTSVATSSGRISEFVRMRL